MENHQANGAFISTFLQRVRFHRWAGWGTQRSMNNSNEHIHTHMQMNDTLEPQQHTRLPRHTSRFIYIHTPHTPRDTTNDISSQHVTHISSSHTTHQHILDVTTTYVMSHTFATHHHTIQGQDHKAMRAAIHLLAMTCCALGPVRVGLGFLLRFCWKGCQAMFW